MNPLTLLAETEAAAAAASTGLEIGPAKALMVAVGLLGASVALGWVGSSYMKALGRNPEAGKAASQIIIIAAMIELTALLAFAGIFVLN